MTTATEPDGPLALSTLQEIWDELARRNEAVILVARRRINEHEFTTDRFYHGGTYTAIGMCECLKAALLKAESETPEIDTQDE